MPLLRKSSVFGSGDTSWMVLMKDLISILPNSGLPSPMQEEVRRITSPVAWGAGELCSPRTIAGGLARPSEASGEGVAGWGPKGGANPPTLDSIAGPSGSAARCELSSGFSTRTSQLLDPLCSTKAFQPKVAAMRATFSAESGLSSNTRSRVVPGTSITLRASTTGSGHGLPLASSVLSPIGTFAATGVAAATLEVNLERHLPPAGARLGRA